MSNPNLESQMSNILDNYRLLDILEDLERYLEGQAKVKEALGEGKAQH